MLNHKGLHLQPYTRSGVTQSRYSRHGVHLINRITGELLLHVQSPTAVHGMYTSLGSFGRLGSYQSWHFHANPTVRSSIVFFFLYRSLCICLIQCRESIPLLPRTTRAINPNNNNKSKLDHHQKRKVLS